MRPLGLFGQTWAIAAAAVVAGTSALTWGALETYQRYTLRNLAAQLETHARMLEQWALDAAPSDGDPGQTAFCQKFGEPRDFYISILDSSGRVICEAPTLLASGTDLTDRAEVAAAMQGRVVADLRPNLPLRKDLLYVAVPFNRGGTLAVIVRTGTDARPVTELSGTITVLATAVAAASLALAGLLAWWQSRSLTATLERIGELAGNYSEGNLDRRAALPDTPELRRLVVAFNAMASRLEKRLAEILARRNEQEAVFLSMNEAVIAVDRDRNVINLNRVAGELFSTGLAEARGRSLLEVVRNPDLQRFMNATLASDGPTEREIELDDAQRILSAHGTALRDAEGRRIGALMVLNDVTRLRRLENLRRDFVANVSHELKTPITSIKGFVETLIDGAVRDPNAAERFLRIISRQADRLSAIIEDLLQLSRIERETEREEVELAPHHLVGILRGAVELCQPQAEEKGMLIELDCPRDPVAAVNPPLLESALVNLIDNAVKYSESGGRVHVALGETPTEIVLSVQDWGPGISADHIPRLFERFYRVDHSRDRKAGGSGLGLSIVKHIAQAHGGRIDVQSQIGQGSTFSLFLPKA